MLRTLTVIYCLHQWFLFCTFELIGAFQHLQSVSFLQWHTKDLMVGYMACAVVIQLYHSSCDLTTARWIAIMSMFAVGKVEIKTLCTNSLLVKSISACSGIRLKIIWASQFWTFHFFVQCSNVQKASTYGEYISQLIQYSRGCISYHDFFEKGCCSQESCWTESSTCLSWIHPFESFTVTITSWLTVKEYLFHHVNDDSECVSYILTTTQNPFSEHDLPN